MPNEEIIQKLQDIINQVKIHYKNGDLKKAKNAYLDAAEMSLDHSKKEDLNKKDKLSFENLAREFVRRAKIVHEEIKANKLPLPPGKRFQLKRKQISDNKDKTTEKEGTRDKIVKDEEKIPDKEELELSIKNTEKELKETFEKDEKITKLSEQKFTEDIPIDGKPYQVLVINYGGIPILSHEFEAINDVTKLKLNEILFSGAITAINQLMEEIIQKPIKNISLEDSVLLLESKENLWFVLFTDKETKYMENSLEKFADKMFDYINDISNNNPATISRDISEDERALAIINEVFCPEQAKK